MTTPPSAECCAAAPPILEFDAEGNLVGSWGGKGGPGYDWPASNHGITVDYKGNVWIGGNGRAGVAASPEEAGNTPAAAQAKQAKAAEKGKAGPGAPPLYHDSMLLKFTREGKFLMSIGKTGGSRGSNDVENLGLPAKIFVDAKTKSVAFSVKLYIICQSLGSKIKTLLDLSSAKICSDQPSLL